MTYLLVFFSGLAGLVYEVLWMKQMGLLFGNTSHAAAATLAAFFAGLAAGSAFWGRRAARTASPLRVYAGLEAGIALTALLYFVVLRLFHGIYPWLYQGIASAGGLLLTKFALALLLIFPPAFCMGGTIPAIGQHLIRSSSTFGATAARLYGVNTFGAALGAFLAGFHLPLWLGFRGTCLGAMAVTGLVAAGALALSRRGGGQPRASVRPLTAASLDPGSASGSERCPGASSRWAILPLAFLSGFGVLALEVLWMRMFAQVLENSVYTFSAILVIVLLCLAAGAWGSSRLARRARSPFHTLALLTLLSGLAIALTPFIFMELTGSLTILASKGSWVRYVLLIFRTGFLAIGVPALLLGTIFPFLMKAEERYAVSAGVSLGRLAAVNTVGAILGSLACGFVFLGTLGLWRTMQLIAALYLFAALVLPLAWKAGGTALKVGGGLGLLLLVTLLNPVGLPINSVDPLRGPEEILETWEGSDCTVAAALDRNGVSIKINSHYGLGSTGAASLEKLQSDIPLMACPRARTLFFLGLGTGITAGSALDPQFSNVTRVVACELVPEVVAAARKYIANFEGQDYTGGLFTDPRATVRVEDGRHYLMAARDRFNLIDSDLFVPYRSGAGSLYSREHFLAVKERLEPGGVFFQWLPLYQVTDNEFGIIARTMLAVFDQVSLWRNNFQPGEEVVALAGHKGTAPLDACDRDTRAARMSAVDGKDHRDLARLNLPFNSGTILFFYCGNLSAAGDLFDGYPLNTDDRPLIEYLAPRTYRDRTETTVPWFVGPRLARLVDEVQRRCPPARDPLLANRTAEERRLPAAGAAYHWARLWEIIGDEAECRRAWRRFVREWSAE